MAESGRIFICYRREETAYSAGWLFDRLADRFGGQIFKDVDSLEPGDDWVEVITRVVGACDVLLALIGDRWLTITDEDGRRRLDDPDDFVRLEIEAALTRNVRVIPILVEGARMPRAAELPPSLAKLARRQALVLSPANFDTSRLLLVLDKTLAEMRIAQEDAAAISAPADKATDRGATELSEAPERRQPAESSPMPSVPPAAPATDREVLSEGPPVSEPGPRPGEAGPPPDEGKSWDKLLHRLPRRAWILVGAGVALVLLVVVIAAIVNQGRGSVIFEDDFSSSASGWQKWSDNGASAGGYYKDGAYNVSAEAGDLAGGDPPDASRVYPKAPPSITIEVEMRIVKGSSQAANYGISCRVSDGSWYAFVVQGVSVTIWRVDSSGANDVAKGTAHVDGDGTNKLVATCEGHETYVYLQLLVNGDQVANFTDDSPLPAGGVNLWVDSRNSEIATEVQFDNFVVTQF